MEKDIHDMTRVELIALVEDMRARAEEEVDFRAAVQEIQSFQDKTKLERKEDAASLRSVELERDRYADLIEFAPVGFLTLDLMGLIRTINLTGATMLGTERSRLINTPLLAHVEESSRRDFLNHLQHCRQESGTVRAQIKLKLARGVATEVCISTRGTPHGGPMRTILTDVDASGTNRQVIPDDDGSNEQYHQGN